MKVTEGNHTLKRFVSINIKSILFYISVVIFVTVIEILQIINNDVMMFIVALVGAWMLFGFYKTLFSRCKFAEDRLYISGDFLFPEAMKIQKKHEINYNDIIEFKIEQLPQGVDSYHNEINISQNYKNQYLSLYGYKIIKCITFYMKNGTKESLIINRYSKKQVNEIIDILNIKVRHSNINIEEIDVIDDKAEYTNIEKEKIPKYVIILFILYALIFAIFAVHSLILGGDALNGFVTDGKYYVSSHGRDTLVTYEEWRLNYILGSATFTAAFLAFGSGGIWFFLRWKKKRNGIIR